MFSVGPSEVSGRTQACVPVEVALEGVPVSTSGVVGGKPGCPRACKVRLQVCVAGLASDIIEVLAMVREAPPAPTGIAPCAGPGADLRDSCSLLRSAVEALEREHAGLERAVRDARAATIAADSTVRELLAKVEATKVKAKAAQEAAARATLKMECAKEAVAAADTFKSKWKSASEPGDSMEVADAAERDAQHKLTQRQALVQQCQREREALVQEEARASESLRHATRALEAGRREEERAKTELDRATRKLQVVRPLVEGGSSAPPAGGRASAGPSAVGGARCGPAGGSGGVRLQPQGGAVVPHVVESDGGDVSTDSDSEVDEGKRASSGCRKRARASA